MRTFNVIVKTEYQYPSDSYCHPEYIRRYNITDGDETNINTTQECDGMDKFATNYGYSYYKLYILLLSLLGVKLKFSIDYSTEEKRLKKDKEENGIDPENSYLYVLENIFEEFDWYSFNLDKEVELIVHYYTENDSRKLQQLEEDEELLSLSEDYISLKIDNKYYEFKLNGEGYWRGSGWLLCNHTHECYNILSDICETVLEHFCVVNLIKDYGVNENSSEEDIIIKIIDNCKAFEDKPTDEVIKKVKEYYIIRKNFPTLSPYNAFINII